MFPLWAALLLVQVYGGRPQQGLYEVRPHERRFASLLEHYRHRHHDPGVKLDAVEEADKEKALEDRSDNELATKEAMQESLSEKAARAEEEALRKEKEAEEAREHAEATKKLVAEGKGDGDVANSSSSDDAKPDPLKQEREEEGNIPEPGSQTWTDCESHGAHRCDAHHCCCNVGTTYDEGKATCQLSEKGDNDPRVQQWQIPGSQYKYRFGLCTDSRLMHPCGSGCCCNGFLVYDPSSEKCKAPPSETGPNLSDGPIGDPAPPEEDPIPGSQTWKASGYTCESKEAYGCGAQRAHCCCRFGCEFIEIWDKCGHCKEDVPKVQQNMIPASHLWEMRVKRGICNAKYSHPCGGGCCCNAGWAWSKEQRRCLGNHETTAVEMQEQPAETPDEGKSDDDGFASFTGFAALLVLLPLTW